MGGISPIILLTIVILAVVFFIFGLVQLLIRCCIKRPSFSSIYQSNSFQETSNSSHTFQRQLHHLFRLHDLGLDRALIDALPVFYYKDIMGLKEPFDCAVCLCEFSDFDKLKFIPSCGHAFHVHCIETWLLSNSTCPLCRGLINPTFEFNESRQWNREYGDSGDEGCQNGEVLQENGGESRVFSIRLGKLKSMNEDCDIVGDDIQGEIRRCYSLGAFQYVVDSLDLQIQLSNEVKNRLFDSGGISSTGGVAICDNGKYVPNGDGNEKKISFRTRGDSFSVSKIWLWPKKDTFLGSSGSNVGVSCSSIGMPVSDRTNAV